jgi:hypothetical protein
MAGGGDGPTATAEAELLAAAAISVVGYSDKEQLRFSTVDECFK